MFEMYLEVIVELVGLGVAEGAKGEGGKGWLAFSL
jgi:hypothetical protein